MSTQASSKVTWRSPGRVNLIGEHTDYNEGFCLPLAIDRAATAEVTARPTGGFSVYSTQFSATVVLPDVTSADLTPISLTGDQRWAGYVLGLVWAMDQRGYHVPPVNIEIDSDVPVGAGLSSSAALECAAAAAIADFAGITLGRSELVAIARQCENDFIGAPTGGMDQLASVYGQAGHVLLCDMRDLSVQAISLPLSDAGLSVLVIDSKAPHQHADGYYRHRRESCESAARVLDVPALRDVSLDQLPEALRRLAKTGDATLVRRARHVITENARTVECGRRLSQGRLADIGELLTASHVSLRDDFEVSVPEVDLAVETMIEYGAMGARITGGGFGGCAIGLIASSAVSQAIQGIAERFDRANFRAPAGFTVLPSPGTHQSGPQPEKQHNQTDSSPSSSDCNPL